MMPTTQQMLAAVQLALHEHVTPNTEDQWAQSALRSVDAILNHLQARVPIEGPMLHGDTGDLVTLLTNARDQLGYDDPALHSFLIEAKAMLAGYARVDDLQALNHRGREVIDALIHHCHASKSDERVDAIHSDVRAYLLKHANRECGFFLPVYVGRPV